MKKSLFLLFLVSILSILACSDDQTTRTPTSAHESDVPILVDGAPDWEWSQVPSDQDFLSVASSALGYIIGGAESLTMTSGDGRTWQTKSHNGTTDILAVTLFNENAIGVGTGPWAILIGATYHASPSTYQENTLRAVTSSDDIVVAVGDMGELITTTDGETWQRHEPICEDDLLAITWTGTEFLVGSEGGDFHNSADGANWTIQDSPITAAITGLVTIESDILAVTDEGEIWRRIDGQWHREVDDLDFALRGIASAGTTVVAVGDEATVAYSHSSGEWHTGQLGVDTDFRGVTAGGSFAVIGSNGVLLFSQDGERWEERPSFSANSLYDIASNETDHVAVGRNGIYSSTDGSEWSLELSIGGLGAYSVVWTGDYFVVCGRAGLFLVSENGQDWINRSSPSGKDLWSAHWTGSEMVLAGDDGGLWITTNFSVWDDVTLPVDGAVFGFAQSPTEIVAVTTSGDVFVTADGRTWSMAASTTRLADVIWTGSEFLALGNSFLLQSANGRDWLRHEIPDAYGLRGLAYDGFRVYVVSGDSKIHVSRNYEDWLVEDSGFDTTEFFWPQHMELKSILFDGEDLLVAADSGVILKRRR